MLNIYLDIDGVIKGCASPQEDIEAFLRYCLDNYSDSMYWLTTHCNKGINRAVMSVKAGCHLPEVQFSSVGIRSAS